VSAIVLVQAGVGLVILHSGRWPLVIAKAELLAAASVLFS
jgi:hypothetical protein